MYLRKILSFKRSKQPPFYRLGLSFGFLNKGLLINSAPNSKDKEESTWKAWISLTVSQNNDQIVQFLELP